LHFPLIEQGVHFAVTVFLSSELFWVFNLLGLGSVRSSSVGTDQNLSLGLEELYNAFFLKDSVSKVFVVKCKVLDLGFQTLFVFLSLIDSDVLVCLGLLRVFQHSKDL
jgi:hypothetical protein